MVGYSPSFQKWCHDLFNYLWEGSSDQWTGELARAAVEVEEGNPRISGKEIRWLKGSS